MSEQNAKERVAMSRLALLQEMGIANSASESAELLTADAPDPTSPGDKVPVRQHSFWIAIGKKTFMRWWRQHPINFALQATHPVVHLYARKNPGIVIAMGAAAGALLYFFRPWRMLSLTSLGMLLLRAPAIPKVALDLVQASQQNDQLQSWEDKSPMIRSQRTN